MTAFSDSEGGVTRQRSFSQLNSEQQDFENVLRAVNTLFQDNSSPGINSFNSFVKYQHTFTVSLDICNGPQYLMKLSLNKKAFQLGESIKGTFDFTKATIPCYQVMICMMYSCIDNNELEGDHSTANRRDYRCSVCQSFESEETFL
jgi:hypothetical protein